MSNNNNIKNGTLPWTKSCFVCGESNPNGMQIKSILKNNEVILKYTTREVDLGWQNIIHGGIITTLLDEVMTWSAMITAKKSCVTAEITTRLKRPVRAKESVTAIAKTISTKGRLILVKAKLLNSSNKIVAEATGKFLPMPKSEFTYCDKDFVYNNDSLKPEEILNEQFEK